MKGHIGIFGTALVEVEVNAFGIVSDGSKSVDGLTLTNNSKLVIID